MIKDILLKKTEENCYDWSFNGLDVDTVFGNQSLINSVIHAVLLRKNELKQEIYLNKGSELYSFIPSPNTPRIKQFITEAIIVSCKEVEGVEEAEVEIELDNNGVQIISLKIINSEGNEVEINGI